MARMLDRLDARASYYDGVVQANAKSADGWEDQMDRSGPDKDTASLVRQRRGNAAVYAVHARNLRRLRNAVCGTMMKVLR